MKFKLIFIVLFLIYVSLFTVCSGKKDQEPPAAPETKLESLEDNFVIQELPSVPDQVSHSESFDFYILPNGSADKNGTKVDVRISEDVALVILKHFRTIEDGDLAAFRTTLLPPEDGNDIYSLLGIIFRYFKEFFDLDDDAYSQAVVNADGISEIMDTAFHSVPPVKSKNTALFVKEIKITNYNYISAYGYDAQIEAVVSDNKNGEVLHFLSIMTGINYDDLHVTGIYEHYDIKSGRR